VEVDGKLLEFYALCKVFQDAQLGGVDTRRIPDRELAECGFTRDGGAGGPEPQDFPWGELDAELIRARCSTGSLTRTG
jgi:hypothetical protein